jgi:hypothetical protein
MRWSYVIFAVDERQGLRMGQQRRNFRSIVFLCDAMKLLSEGLPEQAPHMIRPSRLVTDSHTFP